MKWLRGAAIVVMWSQYYRYPYNMSYDHIISLGFHNIVGNCQGIEILTGSRGAHAVFGGPRRPTQGFWEAARSCNIVLSL